MLESANRREGDPVSVGAHNRPGVIKPLKVPTWRRSAQLVRGVQEVAAIELSS